MYTPKTKHDPFADGRRILEEVEQWNRDNPAPPKPEYEKKSEESAFMRKIGPAPRKGVKIFRWNGVGDDEGVVIKKAKEYLHVNWDGTKEKIEVILFKYQMKVIDNEIIWRWKAPSLEAALARDVRIEGDWENTYDHTGNLVSMRLLATPGPKAINKKEEKTYVNRKESIRE